MPVVAIARADDTTFGILHSRFHELWSLRMGTSLGVGRPALHPTTCFETFPSPQASPRQTPRTSAPPGGGRRRADSGRPARYFVDALPRGLSSQISLQRPSIKRQQLSKPYHPAAMAIAQAAQRLNALRQAWLNPPEWTDTVPEVVPLGLSHRPTPTASCPSRVRKRAGQTHADQPL